MQLLPERSGELSDGDLRAFANHILTAVSRTAPAAVTDRELLARFADARDESAFALLVGHSSPLKSRGFLALFL